MELNGRNMNTKTWQKLPAKQEKALKKLLVSLADKYETASFCNEDPSQFLRWYKKSSAAADIETASFIAAMLAFGSRTQFIPKIKQILEAADKTSGSISVWLKTGTYKKDFPSGTKKFYRFYSYDDMQTFFDELAVISQEQSAFAIMVEAACGVHSRRKSECV